MKKRIASRTRNRSDYVILFCVVGLLLLGFAMLASASFAIAQNRFDESYYYVKQQLYFGLSIGIVGFFLASKIYYRVYQRFALAFLILSYLAVLILFTPLGLELKGATRQIAIGPISFQPSELLKITFIVYLAAWLSSSSVRQKDFKRGFLPFLLLCGSIMFLLILVHSTSAAIILTATAFIMYFASGAKIRYLGLSVALGLVLFAGVIYLTPYRLDRVKQFIAGRSGDDAAAFHLNESLIAIGSGGLTGVGYGQSTTKISYLPEPIGDSIFSVLAEELGFVGVAVVLSLFFVLVMRMFLLANQTRNTFGQLLLLGFGSIIAIQVFINVGAVSGLLPLTGTPLPFISYGKTALVVFMTMAGIALNISKYAR